MKALTVCIIFFCVHSVRSQTVVSSCSAPDSILALYRDDAATMALRRIYDNSYTYVDSAVLPQESMDTVLNALVAVHNAISLPARDTVVNFNIRSIKDHAINSYEIKGDTNLAWMQNLLNWTTTSGHSQLDAFNSNYGFYVASIQNSSWNNYAYIRFLAPNDYYNIFQLIEPVYYFPQMLGVNPLVPGLFGDGPDITHEVFTDHVQLDYYYKWGDCPSGCTAYRKWTFKVYYDCSVEYLGSSGEVLFPTAELNPIPLDKMVVSPNPSTGVIALSDVSGVYNYTITDLRGQLVDQEFNRSEKEIDLSRLPSGQYILTVMNAEGISRTKIIKM